MRRPSLPPPPASARADRWRCPASAPAVALLAAPRHLSPAPPGARASPLPRVTPREPGVNAAERKTTRIPSSRREEGTVEAGGGLVLAAIIEGDVEGVVQQAVQRFGALPRKAEAALARA